MSAVGTEQLEDRGRRTGSSRRRAREVALQVLYAIDVGSGRPRPVEPEDGDAEPRLVVPPAAAAASDPERAFDAVAAHFEMPEGARAFARDLSLSVRERIASIDEVIAAHARNWRIARMAAVDRNILRLATYELAHTDTPVPVVLNEAVDLARRFGSDPSPAFVNGILDAIARGVREPEA